MSAEERHALAVEPCGEPQVPPQSPPVPTTQPPVPMQQLISVPTTFQQLLQIKIYQEKDLKKTGNAVIAMERTAQRLLGTWDTPPEHEVSQQFEELKRQTKNDMEKLEKRIIQEVRTNQEKSFPRQKDRKGGKNPNYKGLKQDTDNRPQRMQKQTHWKETPDIEDWDKDVENSESNEKYPPKEEYHNNRGQNQWQPQQQETRRPNTEYNNNQYTAGQQTGQQSRYDQDKNQQRQTRGRGRGSRFPGKSMMTLAMLFCILHTGNTLVTFKAGKSITYGYVVPKIYDINIGDLQKSMSILLEELEEIQLANLDIGIYNVTINDTGTEHTILLPTLMDYNACVNECQRTGMHTIRLEDLLTSTTPQGWVNVHTNPQMDGFGTVGTIETLNKRTFVSAIIHQATLANITLPLNWEDKVDEKAAGLLTKSGKQTDFKLVRQTRNESCNCRIRSTFEYEQFRKFQNSQNQLEKHLVENTITNLKMSADDCKEKFDRIKGHLEMSLVTRTKRWSLTTEIAHFFGLATTGEIKNVKRIAKIITGEQRQRSKELEQTFNDIRQLSIATSNAQVDSYRTQERESQMLTLLSGEISATRKYLLLEGRLMEISIQIIHFQDLLKEVIDILFNKYSPIQGLDKNARSFQQMPHLIQGPNNTVHVALAQWITIKEYLLFTPSSSPISADSTGYLQEYIDKDVVIAADQESFAIMSATRLSQYKQENSIIYSMEPIPTRSRSSTATNCVEQLFLQRTGTLCKADTYLYKYSQILINHKSAADFVITSPKATFGYLHCKKTQSLDIKVGKNELHIPQDCWAEVDGIRMFPSGYSDDQMVLLSPKIIDHHKRIERLSQVNLKDLQLMLPDVLEDNNKLSLVRKNIKVTKNIVDQISRQKFKHFTRVDKVLDALLKPDTDAGIIVITTIVVITFSVVICCGCHLYKKFPKAFAWNPAACIPNPIWRRSTTPAAVSAGPLSHEMVPLPLSPSPEGQRGAHGMVPLPVSPSPEEQEELPHLLPEMENLISMEENEHIANEIRMSLEPLPWKLFTLLLRFGLQGGKAAINCMVYDYFSNLIPSPLAYTDIVEDTDHRFTVQMACKHGHVGYMSNVTLLQRRITPISGYTCNIKHCFLYNDKQRTVDFDMHMILACPHAPPLLWEVMRALRHHPAYVELVGTEH